MHKLSLRISAVICILHLLPVKLTAMAEAAGNDGPKIRLVSPDAGRDTAKVSLLLKTARFYVNKPGTEAGDMSAAIKYADQAADLARRLNSKKGEGLAAMVFAQIYREQNNKPEALKNARRALEIFSGNQALIMEKAAALMEISNYYGLDSERELDNKIKYYQEGTDLLKTASSQTLKYADALKFLGDLLSIKGDYKRSLATLRESLVIYRACKYEKLQDIYSLIGEVLTRQGNIKESLKYHILAAKTAERFKDSSSTVTAIYNRLGIAYNTLNQLDNTIESQKKGLIYANYNKDNDAVRQISCNLAWTYIRLRQYHKAVSTALTALRNCSELDTMNFVNLNTNLLEAYVRLKQFDKARDCYSRMKKLYGYSTSPDFTNSNYQHAAVRMLLAVKDFSAVPAHIEALEQSNRGLKSLRIMGSVELFKFQTDSAMRKPWSAMAHFRRYKELSDSLSRRNHDKELAQIQVQYETEKKDQDLAIKSRDISTLQGQAVLQERALKSETLARKLAIAGAALATLLLAVGYSRYRLKQRVNTELFLRQEEINKQNGALRKLLTEREWLLKEVHHRVKNNLQIIISLLDSQSVYLTDDTAIDVIRDSQHRMNCISLVHQKLYQNDNLAGIQMKDYIGELITYMKDTIELDQRINFSLNIDEVSLDVSQAVPLGLIMNEAITNSIKYAFKGKTNCNINVDLSEGTDGSVHVSIADNGVGLKKDFDLTACSSLGMNLIQGLSEQLRGELNIFTDKGLHIKLRLPKFKMLNNRDLELQLS